MNQGYNTEEIQKIADQCKAKGKSFIYREDAEKTEEYVNVLFPGTFDGKDVVFDAFIYTLETEYFSNLYEDAQAAVIEQNPTFKEADFNALEGDHIDQLEEFVDDLSEDDSYNVGEFIEEDEDSEYGISLDLCLNVPSITDEIITKFIADYKNGTLKLDETLRSFEFSEDEDI